MTRLHFRYSRMNITAFLAALLILTGLILTIRGRAPECVAKVCNLSINYPFDAKGEPDTRPGTWGRTAADDGKIQFTHVPKGYRVRIERVYGNVTARVVGTAPQNTYAGILFSLINSHTDASPYATMSSSGCMLYVHADVGPNQPRIVNFDTNTHSEGLLEPDNVLLVRRAVYLNETEAVQHIEPSFVDEFRYERP
jgi:hypothetical protein